MVEHRTVNATVLGSSPSPGAKIYEQTNRKEIKS